MPYTLKKKDEKDELNSLIEISGLTSELTPHQLLDHFENTEKILKEQAGQVVINNDQNRVAEEMLPMLKDIPEEHWKVAYRYFERKMQNLAIEETQKTGAETLKTYRFHLENIEKETGIKCLPQVSPLDDGKGNIK